MYELFVTLLYTIKELVLKSNSDSTVETLIYTEYVSTKHVYKVIFPSEMNKDHKHKASCTGSFSSKMPIIRSNSPK